MARVQMDPGGIPQSMHQDLNGHAKPGSGLRAVSGSAANGKKSKFHAMDPDEIFSKYTIHEVKMALNKLRLDVDAKQEELRLMVGERYRDLLQASTSIIAMSDSSTHVVSLISEVKRVIGTDYHLVPNAVDAGQSGKDVQLQIMQSLAAHLKLLLDASEHLWRLLERKKYFQAAWLFLLSRVVYRSVHSDVSEIDSLRWESHGIDVKEQFPIAQRQWENLVPFRTQISHKATLSLRELTMTSNEVCESLLGLHLLDSLPLSDALDVLLKQRSRSLQLLFESFEKAQQNTPSGSSIERTNKKIAKQVWDMIRTVLDAITDTVGTAREVFRETSTEKPSLIKQVLEAMQNEGKPLNFPSLPSELRLSTQTLLSSLPNSNHFLALPSDIRSFRPFVDMRSPSSTVSQRALSSKLQKWFDKATGQLRDIALSWLGRLETIKSVWDIQTSAWAWLSSSDRYVEDGDRQVLHALVGDVCSERIGEMWKSALDVISATFDDEFRKSLRVVEDLEQNDRLNVSPVDFLLSAPPVPSINHINLGASHANTSFERYKHAIGYRLQGMTSTLEHIVATLEEASTRLNSDSECVMADTSYRDRLEGLFASSSDAAAVRLLSTLDTAVHNVEEDCERFTRRIAFMGRLSDKLSYSNAAANMRCSSKSQAEFASRAREIHNFSVGSWSDRVASSTKDKFLKEARHDNGVSAAVTPFSPSPALFDALLSLVDAIQNFGFFTKQELRANVALSVFDGFSRSVSTAISDRKADLVAQDYYDLYLLKTIAEGWGSKLTPCLTILEETLEHVREILPEPQRAAIQNVPTSVTNSLAHARLLLLSLLPPQKSSSGIKSPVSPAFELGKHRGGNTATLEQDVQPILNLVNPTPRFGSLWVGTSA